MLEESPLPVTARTAPSRPVNRDAEPGIITMDKGRRWAERALGTWQQIQAALHRVDASRRAEHLIEKRAELQVENAVTAAAERVRQVEEEAVAAMREQRLLAYQQMAQADAATASLLSVDSSRLHMAASAAAVTDAPAATTTVTDASTTASSTVTDAPEADMCGVAGKPAIPCTTLNRLITWNYQTDVLMGLIGWGGIILIIYPLMTGIMCCANCAMTVHLLVQCLCFAGILGMILSWYFIGQSAK